MDAAHPRRSVIMAFMSIEDFERIIAETVHELPRKFSERIENVEIVLEEYADAETLRIAGIKYPEELLGFYHGIPLTMRTTNYAMVAPDKISIYRLPIIQYYRTPDAIREGIKHTVRHELAHYFGISDERLHELGAY